MSPHAEGQYLPKRPRVLIAEDHPGVAKAICRLLALDCDIVGNVADGRTVLEATQRLQPDVVVVDLNMPHVHGLDVCRQIKQDNPDARVVVFSAMNDPDIRQRSVVGASAFVCKGTGDLLSTVNRLCERPKFDEIAVRLDVAPRFNRLISAAHGHQLGTHRTAGSLRLRGRSLHGDSVDREDGTMVLDHHVNGTRISEQAF